jgi:hypothetical protein
MKAILFALVVGLLMVGCAGTRVTNVTEGRDLPSGTDARTSREAIRTISVTETTPSNALITGSVEAGRGHRDWRNDEPTLEDLINDLKISAYAKGADGISEVQTQKKSGISDNYWWVLQGRAVAWRRQ